MNKMVMICAVAVGLMMGVCGCGVDQSDPESVTKAYVTATFDGNYDMLEKLTSMSDRQREKAKEKLKESREAVREISKQAKKCGLKLLSVGKAEINGDRASVPFVMKVGSGKEEKDTMRLVRKDGKWFVKMY